MHAVRTRYDPAVSNCNSLVCACASVAVNTKPLNDRDPLHPRTLVLVERQGCVDAARDGAARCNLGLHGVASGDAAMLSDKEAVVGADGRAAALAGHAREAAVDRVALLLAAAITNNLMIQGKEEKLRT